MIFLSKANIALAIGANTKLELQQALRSRCIWGRVIGNLREVIYQREIILLQEEAR